MYLVTFYDAEPTPNQPRRIRTYRLPKRVATAVAKGLDAIGYHYVMTEER